MDDILSDLQSQYVFNYIENITIFSPTIKKHFIDFNKVFLRLEAVNLKVNLMKYRFNTDKVKVFSHIVS